MNLMSWKISVVKPLAVNILVTLLLVMQTYGELYLNHFAVEIKGGKDKADQIAAQLGFKNKGQVGPLENFYVFEHHQIEKRSASPHTYHHTRLKRHPEVLWSEQQVAKKRVKRDYITIPVRSRRAPSPYTGSFSDPLYEKEWYLHGGGVSGFDMNVKPAWEKGYTGRGVVVTLLDDGLEHNHTDLFRNYDPKASYDINDNDYDPMPRYDDRNENRHGTRCAGEVAAIENNSKCGVGVAFNAKIGGVRMLDGDVSDVVEASSLGLNREYIDIYSASWGPDDNGKVVDGPALLAKKAFEEGANKGRNGKGSIFVWASGNGGSNQDSCNCDGYTNSVYTLSISSVSEENKKPWYLEECSSTLATTYSSGDNVPVKEKQVVTTDLRNQCTESHTGTSASAPLAAGICALALEANPNLTWRDMQHIVVLTANPAPMVDGDWIFNGVGRKVSLKYGYGLMNAGAMVDLALKWKTVPDQHVCYTAVDTDRRIIEREGIVVSMETKGCHEQVNRAVKYLEHVQLKLSLRYSRRGALKIHLLSPNGTKSTLLLEREHDVQAGEFDKWPFMSVQFWGENPTGKWTVTVENTGSLNNNGELIDWQLVMYGTDRDPLSSRPRSKDPRSKHSRLTENSKPTSQYESDYFDHYYSDDRPGKCHDECLSGCHGSTANDCVDCRHFRIGNNGPCVSVCPTGQYNNIEQRSCIACDETCRTCSGPDRTQCLSCSESYFYIDELGTCTITCPDGYYADVGEMTCRLCEPMCEKCSESSDKCTSCPQGSHLDHHTCVMKCRDDQFHGSDGSCHMCSNICAQCSGPTDYNCISCWHDTFFANGTCIQQCPPHFYGDNIRRECSRCHVSCGACKGPNENDCQVCRGDLHLQKDGSCKTGSAVCHSDEFKENELLCKKCHKKCRTCSGETRFDCLSCQKDRYLHQGECVVRCGQRYYIYVGKDVDGTEIKECRDCNHNCQRCNGGKPNDCTMCVHGLKLLNNECKTTCNYGLYADEFGSCMPCDKSCSQCSGLGNSNCTKCQHTSQVLMQGKCLSSCPRGYFKAYDDQCQKCYRNCQTCTDEGPHSCKSCEKGFMLIRGICKLMPSCASNKFYDIHAQECRLCDKKCKTCQGYGPSNCTSCIGMEVYNVQNHECILCCSDTVKDNCCNCHPDTGVCLEDRNIKQFDDVRLPIEGSITGMGNIGLQSNNIVSSEGIVTLSVISCFVIVCLFFLVFGLLQAYSNDWLCFKSSVRYQALPTKYNHKTENLLLTKHEVYQDDDEEDEVYPGDRDIIIN